MFKTKRLLFILLFVSNLSAQTSGVVKDSLTEKPIPYVNIWVENENIGTTSNENGFFDLALNDNKNIVFSALGYETKTLRSSEAQNVKLISKEYELNEVILQSSKRSKQIKIGNYETSGFRYHLNYNYNAVYFELSDEILKYPFLKEIKFITISDIQSATIRIRIVGFNSDQTLGKDMLDEQLIVAVKKGSKVNKIDISKFNIIAPENGFYIVFEKLLIEENKHCTEHNYKDKSGKKKKIKSCSYEPNLAYIPTEENNSLYSMNATNWKKQPKIEMKNPKSYENLLMRKYHNNYLTPSVEIIFTN